MFFLKLMFGVSWRIGITFLFVSIMDPIITNYQRKMMIEDNFEIALKVYNASKYYSDEKKECIVRLLYNAQTYYRINHRRILAIWMHESRMKPYALNGKNWNGTWDKGLGQVNSNSMRWFCRLAKGYRFLFEDVDYEVNLSTKRTNRQFYYELSKPRFNAILSISYIIRQHKRYGHKGFRSIIAYNAGSPRPLYGDFKRYYASFTRNYQYLKGETNEENRT